MLNKNPSLGPIGANRFEIETRTTKTHKEKRRKQTYESIESLSLIEARKKANKTDNLLPWSTISDFFIAAKAAKPIQTVESYTNVVFVVQ